MSAPAPAQPTQYAGWASGPSGSIRIVEPSSTEKALGWQAGVSGASGFMGGVPPSTYFNWAMNLDYQWQKYLNEVRGEGFVDSQDGDLLLTGATVYLMTQHGRWNDVAIGPSAVLDANGWGINARLITGVSGVILSEGGPGGMGSSTPLGVYAQNGYYFRALRGVPGAGPFAGQYGEGTGFIGTGYGLGGAPTLHNIQNAAGAGGGTGGMAGGVLQNNFSGTSVGPVGAWAKLPGIADGIASWFAQQSGYTGSLGVTSAAIRGGAGGGAGSNGSQNATMWGIYGGGGGAGGGFLPIVAQELNFRGTVRVRGGNGGTGFAGDAGHNSGGGGGGGGGRAVLMYGRKTLWSVNYDSRGGLGGVPVNSGLGQSGGTGFPGATGSTMLEYRLP